MINDLTYGKGGRHRGGRRCGPAVCRIQPRSGHCRCLQRTGRGICLLRGRGQGDPKGLLPGINAAIAKLNSENKLQSFIDAANDLSTKAVEAN